ncbi:hypothetical protein [Scopulibacillus cellulosilyticus]|uniref:Membrane protein DUF2207 n=1 Tax=Scopulibacillus cellulosilyticus TaxID=2665665 RepID=A0ABW2PVQ6_9BACL
MIWEFFVNLKAHVNESIFYTLTGDFEMAKTVIDTRWFLLYIFVYIFTMWDTYSLAIDINKYSQLSDRTDSPIKPFNIGAIELNFLDPRKPWNAAFWGFVNPGLEAIYNNRLPMGFFSLIIFILAVYKSNVLPAIHLTFEGKTESAGSVINYQWFLNLPSLMLFSASSGYHDIRSTNQLFKIEQSRYLTDNYQPKNYIMPNNKKEKAMYFISTFQHSAYVELALIELEQKGIYKGNIFAAPLDKNSITIPDVERAHKEDTSKYELAFIFGAIFMLLGSIYGFVLVWGPIIWAFIGLVLGAMLGIFISLIIKKSSWLQKKTKTEVVLIVECENYQSELVERVLWQHKALGVTKT